MGGQFCTDSSLPSSASYCSKLLSCFELLVTCNEKTAGFSLFCVWTCVHLLVLVMAVELQSLQLFLGLWLCQTRSSATGCRKIQVSNPLVPILSSWKVLLQLSGLCSARASKSSEYCRVLGATVVSESRLNLQWNINNISMIRTVFGAVLVLVGIMCCGEWWRLVGTNLQIYLEPKE